MEDVGALLKQHFESEASRITHVSGDPVVVVRRRAAARRRKQAALVSTAALVAVTVAVGGAWAMHERSPANTPISTTSPTPTPTPTASSPSPSPSPSPSATPSVSVPAARTTIGLTFMASTTDLGARRVGVVVHITGLVPLDWDGQSQKFGDPKVIEVQGTSVDWGDGSTPDGSDPGTAGCHSSAPVVPLKETFSLDHTYVGAGTYTVKFTAYYCSPDIPVSQPISSRRVPVTQEITVTATDTPPTPSP